MAVETAVGELGSPHQPDETSLRDSVAQKLRSPPRVCARVFWRFPLLTCAWIDSPASKTFWLEHRNI